MRVVWEGQVEGRLELLDQVVLYMQLQEEAAPLVREAAQGMEARLPGLRSREGLGAARPTVKEAPPLEEGVAVVIMAEAAVALVHVA